MSQSENSRPTPDQSTFARFFQPQRATWWDSVFLGVLLLAMCSQINIGDIGQDTTREGYVTKQLKIALPDIALLLNFGWFIARTILMRAWKKLWWPPLPCWALIFAMLLAFVHSDAMWSKAGAAVESVDGGLGAQLKAVLKDKGTFQSIKEAIAEIIQYGLYFLVAPWLFVNLIHDRRSSTFIERRKFALGMFAIAVVTVVSLALLENARVELSAQEVVSAPRASWGSPNIFNSFVALALPLLLAWTWSVTHEREWPYRWSQFLSTFAFVSLTVVASVWSAIATFIGIVVVFFFSLRPMRVLGAVTSLVWLGAGAYIWNTSPPNHPRAEFMRLNSATQPVKKQFVEWYASQGFAVPRQRAFATGVGPGNYQINIGTYYGSGLPNEEKMPPDSNNLYLVQAVSIGLLGLGALLWVIFHFVRLAWQARKYFADDWLASAVLASLAAWLFVNLFHAMIVRGAGVVLAFVLSLAVVAARLNWRDQSTLIAGEDLNLSERPAQPGV